MRLLNVYTLQFREFYSNPPLYVIASHRWYNGQEMTIKDVQKGRWIDTPGVRKLLGFLEYVKSNIVSVQWFWMDTCCVNQKSDREVSETVNSMFRWYRNATICLVYLADVGTKADNSGDTFQQSEWFRRGWTLQELLASQIVVFLDQNWGLLGHKGGDRDKMQWYSRGILGYEIGDEVIPIGDAIEQKIEAVTGIPVSILRDYELSKDLSVAERMRWIDGRQTTCAEDMSYSLLGIFDVTLPVIYGEGADRARRRLLEEIFRPPTKIPSEIANPNNNKSDVPPPRDTIRLMPPPLPRRGKDSPVTLHESGWRSRSNLPSSDLTSPLPSLHTRTPPYMSYGEGPQRTDMDPGKKMLFQQYEIGYKMMADQAAEMRRQGRHSEAEKVDAMVISMRNRLK